LSQVDEVHSGRGHQSHWVSQVHFGLSGRYYVDRIKVRWIGGGTDVIESVAEDRFLIIKEGNGKASIR